MEVKPKVSDVRVQTLVLIDSENGSMQESFLRPMHARVFLGTDARNQKGNFDRLLLGNGCAQGLRQIPDARNLHPGLRATPLTFFELVQKTCQVRFSYLFRHSNLCKGPQTQ